MYWIIAGLAIVVFVLAVKIIILKKSVREIRADFAMLSKGEVNGVIRTESRDRDIMKLASDMNASLEEMRKYYLLYSAGDAEMKTAVTNISHDLRTPLTAISGYLELLKSMEKSDEVEKYLSVIEERTARMKKLTEEMFEYSVIAGTAENEVCTEDVCLNQIIENCVIDYYGALSERGIEPELDITENRIVRKLNRSRTERVFSNLISNAVKYSDGDLRISMDDRGVITFSNKASGLSSVSVEKLFGRFYTVENARNSTGLGLAIAKTFVTDMNGEIHAEYENGRLSVIVSFSE